jgi:hypothetical protein
LENNFSLCGFSLCGKNLINTLDSPKLMKHCSTESQLFYYTPFHLSA